MKETSKLIWAVALSLSFVLCSFMFVYSKTLQRSADDIVKIHAKDKSAVEARFDSCVASAFLDNVQDCNKIKELVK